MNELIAQLPSAYPILSIVLGAMAVLMFDLFGLKIPRLVLPAIFSALAWSFSEMFLRINPGVDLGGALFTDTYVFIFNSLIIVGMLLNLALVSAESGEHIDSRRTDIDALMMFATAGAMVMCGAKNLIVLFVGFELLSVSVYALSGLARKEKASAEAALKYFVLGAFTSAFLLYGMVLVYAATGTMEISALGGATVATSMRQLFVLGIGLMIFGLGFKVSLVPFHFWTPDVYQGAPTSIASFMAVVVKLAAFGAFLRVMHAAFGSFANEWQALVWLLAVLTMTVGNLSALRQQSVKRMLAYSSIAHAGYALMGVLVVGGSQGVAATMFYLLVYSFMTLASFGIVLLVTSGSDAQYDRDTVESFAGLGWTYPFRALALVIALLSLAGIPPLAGFLGKFYLFRATLSGGFLGLVIIAALNSVVSLYYYLRVVVVMYFGAERSALKLPEVEIAPAATIMIATLALLLLGLMSGGTTDMIALAAQSL